MGPDPSRPLLGHRITILTPIKEQRLDLVRWCQQGGVERLVEQMKNICDRSI
jgi:hypothetical protein